MESLFLLIPLSVALVFVIAGLFWWSVRSGQFDDLEGPAHRILMDDEPRQLNVSQTLKPEDEKNRTNRADGSAVGHSPNQTVSRD